MLDVKNIVKMSTEQKDPVTSDRVTKIRRNPKRQKPSDPSRLIDPEVDYTLSDLIDEIFSLKTIVNLCYESIKTLREENASLKLEFLKFRDNNKFLCARESYAEQLKKNSEPEIIIIPKNKSQNSEETKKDLKKCVSPSKICVDSLRKGAKGEVIVKCANKKSSDI